MRGCFNPCSKLKYLATSGNSSLYLLEPSIGERLSATFMSDSQIIPGDFTEKYPWHNFLA